TPKSKTSGGPNGNSGTPNPVARPVKAARPAAFRNDRRFVVDEGSVDKMGSGGCGDERLLGETASDHAQAEGLVGPFETRQHPRGAEVAAHGELLRVSHPAVELQCLPGDPLRSTAHVRLHHARLERTNVAAHLAGDVVAGLATR